MHLYRKGEALSGPTTGWPEQIVISFLPKNSKRIENPHIHRKEIFK